MQDAISEEIERANLLIPPLTDKEWKEFQIKFPDVKGKRGADVRYIICPQCKKFLKENTEGNWKYCQGH